jgi:hypothetical protein
LADSIVGVFCLLTHVQISKVSEGKEEIKAMLDFTNIDHLYVYHHNKHEFSSYIGKALKMM